MTREELELIAEFAKEHDIVVISDEIYSELTYGRDHVSIASLPEMKDRSIVINGFSKAFAMTGWRLGYVAAPRYMSFNEWESNVLNQKVPFTSFHPLRNLV